MQKKYLIFDLDGTLINSQNGLIDLIWGFIKDHVKITKDEMAYLFNYKTGTPLEIQMCDILGSEKKGKELTDKIYEEILIHNKKNPANFFSGVPEKILELSKKYKLFLTTGNHTDFAKEVLEKGGIIQCFEEIYGSDKIHKGMKHLEIFKENSCDKNFFEKAVYIGDGNSDREFAKIFDIDFIHIGSEKKDKYEIKSVVEISEILWKIEKKNNLRKWISLKEKIEFFGNEKKPEICEIWYVNLGENVGFEQSGKGNDYSRPFIVTKKIGSLIFGFPLSSIYKDNFFYKKLNTVKFEDKKYFRKNSMVLLSQGKVLDKKRFIKVIGKINFSELKNIKKMFKNLYL